MIDQDTLHNTGAVLKKYQKGKLLFEEGDITHYYLPPGTFWRG